MDFTDEDRCVSWMSKQIPLSVTANWIRVWLQQEHCLNNHTRHCLNELKPLLDFCGALLCAAGISG
jgi:hypothetical protein